MALLGLSTALVAITLLLVAAVPTAHAQAVTGNLAYATPIQTWPELAVREPGAAVLRRRLLNNNGGGGKVSFPQGVASGDPTSSSVIIWSRLHRTGRAPYVQATYVVSEDASLKTVAAKGSVYTSADVDWTLKVDVTGLKPYTKYYFQWHSNGRSSVIGETKTMPSRDADIDRARFGVVSCANIAFGYFSVYGKIADRKDELDAVLALGDWIYEYKNGHGLVNMLCTPWMLLTEGKTSAGLTMLLFKFLPVIAVADDHEVANNGYLYGAENHQPATEGSWSDRRANGIRAFYEYLPIRPTEGDDLRHMYRSFHFGNLLDLIMLDTRYIGREKQASPYDGLSLFSPTRTILGPYQQTWLDNELSASNARGASWRVIGQQVMFTPIAPNTFTFTGPLVGNPDQWDGYVANRDRLLKYLKNNGIRNNVILSGDIHSAWANDVSLNDFDPSAYNATTGAGSLAVEYVSSSVTSPFLPYTPAGKALQQIAEASVYNTMHTVKFVNLFDKGFLYLDISKERSKGHWVFVKNNNLTDGGGEVNSPSAFASLYNTDRLIPVPV
eukprot:jgi/Chlat1/1622/Chrsp127S01885